MQQGTAMITESDPPATEDDGAPERDIVKIDELTGPRGGIIFVLHLACGDFLTVRSAPTSRKTARCIACWARARKPDLPASDPP